MSPDDPRHGTNAGYVAGCRELGCLRAKTRYDKRRRLELLETGQYRKTPSYRAVRRLQALQVLGWSVPAVATRTGLSARHLYNLHRYPTVYTSTFDAIDAVYEALSATPPAPTTTVDRISVTRTVRHAARAGWPPPLAWDNIDDPAEDPTGWEYREPTRIELLEEYVEDQLGLTWACHRLGVTAAALQKWCGAHDLHHLYRALAGQDGDRQPNQHTRDVA